MEKAKHLYDRFGHLLLGLLAFILIAFTLFGADEIGLSDNGDFSRVIRASSIRKTGEQSRFVYVSGYEMELQGESSWEQVGNLLFSGENVDRYPSVHLLFVRVSTLGNYVFNKLIGADPALYRLGILSLFYALCYSFALSRLFRSFHIKNRVADIVCKALALVVLCDSGYTAYFNSFYSEPVQMIGFVLTVAGCLHILSEPRLRIGGVIWMTLAALLYGWSKFANLPVALLVIIVFSIIAFSKCRHFGIFRLMAVSLAVIVGIFLLIPDWMSFETNYNAVFFGALYDTTEERQKEYLQDLGLSEEYTELAETNAYVKRVQETLYSAEFQEAFRHVSKTQLLLFYAKHPEQLVKLADIAIRNSGFLRPYYLSNYSGAYARFTRTHRFSLWSDLRVQLGFDHALVNLLLALVFVSMFLVLQRRREKRLQVRLKMQSILVLLCVTGILLYCLLVPVVSNGAGDVSKHMFAYAQVMDLLFFAILFMGAALCCEGTLREILPGLAGGLLAVLIVSASPVIRFAATAAAAGEAHDTLETGAYVQLGMMDADPLIWQAVSEEGGVFELLCSESVAERAFSSEGEFGSNYWPDSELRAWLNGDFLESFSDEEQAAIARAVTENTFLLSGEYEEHAVGGTSDFYCMHIPSLAANGYGKAIYGTADDLVYLPDIAMISSLSKEQGIAAQSSYWLETPYYSNGSMLRVVFPDGYIYFRDASEKANVRPVVRITGMDVSAGSGSYEDPFILTFE